jgi:hypothetical protein
MHIIPAFLSVYILLLGVALFYNTLLLLTLAWVAFYSPSGFESYFREIGRRAPDDPMRSWTPEERAALDARFGIRYLR